MQITDVWLGDLPQQFQGKKKIEILIRAFARQMEEIEAVLTDINSMTDISTADGINLDYVGDIVCMTRKEAGELVKKRFQEPVISDEKYRQYLKYGILRNTSDCTYGDIMKAIEILWDVDKASYYERKDRPATIFIGLPPVGIDDEDQAAGKPDILKPGGVGFIYTARYAARVDNRNLEKVIFNRLAVQMFFRFFEMRILDGSWLLDGSVVLEQKLKYDMRPHFSFPLSICEKETVRMDSVMIRKDLWHLNGAYSLDGERLLDAEIREEAL